MNDNVELLLKEIEEFYQWSQSRPNLTVQASRSMQLVDNYLSRLLTLVRVYKQATEHYADTNYTEFDTSCNVAKAAKAEAEEIAK